MEVIFSLEATETLLVIVELIEIRWNRKIADDFLKKVYRTIDVIASNPNSFPLVANFPNARKAVVTKQTSIIYKVNSENVEILVFWDNRQELLF